MSYEYQAGCRFAFACGAALLLLVTAQSPAVAVPPSAWTVALRIEAVSYQGDGPLGRFVHRITTRAEHTIARLWNLVGTAGMIWISLFASALVFLLVAAVSSAADLRMLAALKNGLGAVLRPIVHGALTFLRILRDRRTPAMARLVLVSALVYWLVPRDLVPDDTLVPGFLDDLLIAGAAAKGFIYLCPDSLVARHAAAVEARA